MSHGTGPGRKVLSKGALVRGIVVFSVSVLFLLGFDRTLDYTDTTEFCTSCHSQKIPYEEYRESLHYVNLSGVRTGCADCHVPKELGPKLLAKVLAAKDVYHEIIGTIDTREKFEAHRWRMANRVWEKMHSTDSRECRSCHTVDAMDLAAQDSTARKKHRNAEERGQTCIECHKGVAHEEPFEPDDSV